MDRTVESADNFIEPIEMRQISPSGSTRSSSRKWHFFGKVLPRSEIVFFVQVILVYIVVIVSIVNLTIGRSDDKLWIALLSSSIGYLLPNPSLKLNNNKE